MKNVSFGPSASLRQGGESLKINTDRQIDTQTHTHIHSHLDAAGKMKSGLEGLVPKKRGF